MERFVYIHGFNSNRNSRSAALLEQALGVGVFRVEYDAAQPMDACSEQIVSQLARAAAGSHAGLCVMGSSLGGFYALLTAVRCPAVRRVAAFNPVVYPAVQLAQFLGLNTMFVTGRQWEFTRTALYSYAKAPDPRAFAVRRDIVLGRRDELLDWQMCAAYWEGFARLSYSDDMHQIADFKPFLPLLCS